MLWNDHRSKILIKFKQEGKEQNNVTPNCREWPNLLRYQQLYWLCERHGKPQQSKPNEGDHEPAKSQKNKDGELKSCLR